MRRIEGQRLWTQAAVAALLLAALWRRDCVLLACAPLLAHRSYLLHMQRGLPQCPLRAATRVITSGLLSLGTALAVGAHVLAVQRGWWWAEGRVDLASAAWLAAAAVPLVALQPQRAPMRREALFWLAVLVAAALTAWPQPLPFAAGACVFALGTAALLVLAGWRLAHDAGSALLGQAAHR